MIASRWPGVEPVCLRGERLRPAAGGRRSAGEERGQRRVGTRHQDRDPFGRGQVADHHRGHALAVGIEEQHVPSAHGGQRAGQLAVAVAGGCAFGRSDRPGVGRVAGRQRAGRQRGRCRGRVGGGGRPRRRGRAEHRRRDQRRGGQVAKSHRGVLPARFAFRSGSYGRRWLAGVGLASRLPACPAGMRPAARPIGCAASRAAAGRRGQHHPLLGYELANTPPGGRSFQSRAPTLGA